MVTLTDTSFPDCIWNQLIDINEPDEELAISLIDSKLELDCFGDCDGFIDINVSGGTGLYTFDWSNADNLARAIHCSNRRNIKIRFRLFW